VQIRAKPHRPERNELDLKYRVTLTIEIIFVRLATHLRIYVGTLSNSNMTVQKPK
jgi:hypothetical protein